MDAFCIHSGSVGYGVPMNRNPSTRFLIHSHFFHSAFCPQTPSPNPEGSRSKMRRDMTSGRLPKLLFVLISETAHKTQYGKGPILCDGVSISCEPHFTTTRVLSMIPPTCSFYADCFNGIVRCDLFTNLSLNNSPLTIIARIILKSFRPTATIAIFFRLA